MNVNDVPTLASEEVSSHGIRVARHSRGCPISRLSAEMSQKDAIGGEDVGARLVSARIYRWAETSPAPTKSQIRLIRQSLEVGVNTIRAIYMTALKRGRDDSESATFNPGSHPEHLANATVDFRKTLPRERRLEAPLIWPLPESRVHSCGVTQPLLEWQG